MQSGPTKGKNQIPSTTIKVVLSTKFHPIHGVFTDVNDKDSERKVKQMSRTLRGTCAYGCRALVRYWGLQASKRISSQSNVQPRMEVQQLFIGCWGKSTGNRACLTFWNRFQFETVCRAQSPICCTHCPENLFTFFYVLIYIGICDIYDNCRKCKKTHCDAYADVCPCLCIDWLNSKATTVIPRLTKIIRSGITFVSRNLR